MLKTVTATALLLSFVAPLNAASFSTICHQSRGSIICNTAIGPALNNSAKVIHVNPRGSAESDAAWVERCKPRVVKSAHDWEPGYYVYGNPACGRTE